MRECESYCSGLVSIIMPARNAEGSISKAIYSILNQSYKKIELIIVNDMSVDRTAEIIKTFAVSDLRIKFIQNHTLVSGVYNARNIGLDAARGQYIAFLDADDQLLNESILSRVNLLVKTNSAVVFGPYYRVNGFGQQYEVRPPASISYLDMLKFNYIGNLTGMYDQSLIGKFYQHNIKHEDYLMWCQIVKIAGAAISTNAAPLANYTVSSNSISANKFKAFFWRWHVLRAGLKINIFHCFYYQLNYAFRSLILRAAERFSFL